MPGTQRRREHLVISAPDLSRQPCIRRLHRRSRRLPGHLAKTSRRNRPHHVNRTTRLGHHRSIFLKAGITPFYDFGVAVLTRENRWRSALIEQVRPRPGEVIVDVGCGTGSLLVRLGKAAPSARLTGLILIPLYWPVRGRESWPQDFRPNCTSAWHGKLPSCWRDSGRQSWCRASCSIRCQWKRR